MCTRPLQDTQWFLQRMARATDANSPDEDSSATPVTTSQNAEALVLETHRGLTTKYLTTHAVNRFSAQNNPGVGRRQSKSNKRLRSECLQEACRAWPHLLREVPAGKASKFERRAVRVDHMNQILEAVCDDLDVQEVFGAWDDWKWPEEAPGEATWDSMCEGLVWLPLAR